MSEDESVAVPMNIGESSTSIVAASEEAATKAGQNWGPKLPNMLPDFGPINRVVAGTNGADALTATAEGDVVLGMPGADQLGSTFNRTALFGNQGDDTLTTDVIVPLAAPGDALAAKGQAFQFGGEGDDILSATMTLQGASSAPFSQRVDTASILADGGGGNDTIRAEARLAGTTTTNVDLRTEVRGWIGNDQIDAVADAKGALNKNTVANFVDGGAGDDHITALARTELVASSGTASNVVKGGDGNDFIEASAIAWSLANKLASNVLDGGNGNDVLHAYTQISSNVGLAQSVTDLWGGEGDDELVAVSRSRPITIGLNENNHLNGGTGRDVLSVDSKSETATANVHNLLEGGAGDDAITSKLDTVASGGFGGGGGGPIYDLSNLLKGGTGDDVLDASLTVRLLNGGGGTSSAENLLYGGQGNDQLTAFAQLTNDVSTSVYKPLTNHLDGGAGNDVLTATIAEGTNGSSLLDGGAGNDVLTVFGGTGNLLNGGGGKDTLIGGTGSDFMDGGKGQDVLVFAPSNGHDTAAFTAGEDLFDLTALAAGNIHAFSDLNIEVVAENSIIHFDADNDITVLKNTQLSASDFLFA